MKISSRHHCNNKNNNNKQQHVKRVQNFFKGLQEVYIPYKCDLHTAPPFFIVFFLVARQDKAF